MMIFGGAKSLPNLNLAEERHEYAMSTVARRRKKYGTLPKMPCVQGSRIAERSQNPARYRPPA
jgi:hypothetical protein